MRRSSLHAKRHVGRVQRICHWLETLGIDNPKRVAQLAIDLADGLYAAKVMNRELGQLLKTNPHNKNGADRALTHAINLQLYASEHVLLHFKSLLKHWDKSVIRTICASTGKKAHKIQKLRPSRSART